MRLKINVALTACAVLLAPAAAWAQAGGASLGVRATGLGAFVAVADDASAVAWNPGGLAAGPIFNLLIDLGRVSDHPPPDRPAEGRGERVQSTLLAFGTLPLGLAYYRIRTAEVEAAPLSCRPGSEPSAGGAASTSAVRIL